MKRPPRYTIMNIEEALAHGYRYLVVEVTSRGEVLGVNYFYYAHNAEAWCAPPVWPAPDDTDEGIPPTEPT